MELYIYTKANDLSLAAARSLADLTSLIAALDDPGDAANAAIIARVTPLPDVALGDNEPLTLHFKSAAGTYEAFAGDAAYSVAVAIGERDANGLYIYSETTANTIAGSTRTGTLALNTADLKSFVAGEIASRPRRSAARAWLQIRVTDASINKVTYLQAQINLLASVLDPYAWNATVKDVDLTFVQALRTRSAQANVSGNTTVMPGVLAILHTEIVTFTGAGSTTRIIILAIPTGLSAGLRCAVRCLMPATAAITVEFRNALVGGTLITSFVSDTSGDDKVAEFEFDGAAWQFLRFDGYATA